MPKCSNPSGSGTCVLTPEIARALAEDWADGHSVASITADLRAEGHKVWPADVTWWCIDNRKVMVAGKEYGFRELMTATYPRRVMDMYNEAVEIADSSAKRKEDPRLTAVRVNVRLHAIRAMTPKHVQLDVSETRGFVLPYNDLFAASEDAKPN